MAGGLRAVLAFVVLAVSLAASNVPVASASHATGPVQACQEPHSNDSVQVHLGEIGDHHDAVVKPDGFYGWRFNLIPGQTVLVSAGASGDFTSDWRVFLVGCNASAGFTNIPGLNNHHALKNCHNISGCPMTIVYHNHQAAFSQAHVMLLG